MPSFSLATTYLLEIWRKRNHSRRVLRVPSAKVVLDGARMDSATENVQGPGKVVRVKLPAKTLPRSTRALVDVHVLMDGTAQTARRLAVIQVSIAMQSWDGLATGVMIMHIPM